MTTARTRGHAPANTPTGPDQAAFLSPAQRTAWGNVDEALAVSPIVGLMGAPGVGKTRIAQALAEAHGGRLIGMSDIYEACIGHEPAKWEEAVERLVMDAFEDTRLVIFDDITHLGSLSSRATTRGEFFFRVLFPHLVSTVIARDLRLVLVGNPPYLWQVATDVFGEQAAIILVPEFSARDYAMIMAALLGAERVADVDFQTVFRHSSMLNCYQLSLAAGLLRDTSAIDAETLIACLESRILFANTRTEQVEALSFDTLPGIEDIVEELETHLILPFENRALAQQMSLKPKRGVLLYGPPGTGKTSIGRALAHRIKGKFFLIDGSFVSEPPDSFFRRVQHTVHEAKANSPSILFIDDADILFKLNHIAGLSRYMLSLLDGLESESASNVCVMMTAMDVSKIPEALLRSGRVELWLETRVPDQAVRERILRRWMGMELPASHKLGYAMLAEATQGFTAADLRRVVGDAKLLYAADIVAGNDVADAMFYVVAAINEIVTVRADMAAMLTDPSLRVGHLIAAVEGSAPQLQRALAKAG